MFNEKQLVHALGPIIDEAVSAHKRIDALEKGSTRTAGDKAADTIAQMADSFRADSMPVRELPHLKMAEAAAQAFGISLRRAVPEIYT